jgi:hypothetical protein
VEAKACGGEDGAAAGVAGTATLYSLGAGGGGGGEGAAAGAARTATLCSLEAGGGGGGGGGGVAALRAGEGRGEMLARCGPQTRAVASLTWLL